MSCPICNNNQNNTIFKVKEMQIGLREEFEYIECSKCGCLYIKEIPSNIGDYYDSDYQPHSLKNNFKEKIENKIYGLILSNNVFMRIIPEKRIPIFFKFWRDLLKNKKICKDSKILDIGCGNGAFLSWLKNGGYKNLTGIDLFIDKNNMIPGINLIQTSLEDYKTSEKYDVIISNHAFEHMDKQLTNLKCFEKLIKDDGIIIIRIPIKSELIWKKYGVNWFQIDAPRHYILHTKKSFEILCTETNLEIIGIASDSFFVQFTFSEKYKKNISMRDKDWNQNEFTKKQIREFKNQTEYLNKINEGDQTIFLLKLKN